MKTIFSIAICGSLLACLFPHRSFAQDSSNVQKLNLLLPVADFSQNAKLPYHYPSMQQSLAWSNNFYDAGFYGIDRLGNKLLGERKALRGVFNYAGGLAFAQWGSELPIPLGVWAHEEFHRAVLGVNGVSSKNGNWILNRWNGTVYGVADSTLAALKQDHLPDLLYSYVAGVQSEVLSTRVNVIQDVYQRRTVYKNPLYLYNAYYVWNYFRYSASSGTDSAKVILPQHESSNATERDYAGADLTAWAYDMFTPSKPYTDRSDFPGGEGENRVIGYSELTAEAKSYLKKQKQLSLLNFINPAIFCINRFEVSGGLSFNAFFQYAPTPFGNDISIVVPVSTPKNNLLFAVHNYNNRTEPFFGLELGLVGKPVGKYVTLSVIANGWMQPEHQDFYAQEGTRGGALDVNVGLKFSHAFSVEVGITAKTAGWMMGNPYLDRNISGRLGLRYQLAEKPARKGRR